ncbi:MAG TPA: HlyD family efflux transporter periplasmic adaptor subunit [Nitrospirae bacterium]|nr:HlyD family efflux transporter periplasmic adaptor subunit [Nitrospirota bacterium]
MTKRVLVAIILALFLVAALVFSRIYLKGNKKEPLLISGRVEADEIMLASEIQGRLVSVNISDGMEVKRGDVVARIDDRELKAQREELLKEIKSRKARIKAAETNLEHLGKEIQHQIEQAQKLLSMAESRKNQIEKDLVLKRQRHKRYSELFAKGVIPKDRYEEIELAYRTAVDELKVARAEVERARAAVKNAIDSRLKIKAARDEIKALRASLDAMKETLRLIEVRLSYTVIKSPVDGIVLKKTAEPGEVLAPGGVVGIVIDPHSIYVKTYLPEPYLGKVRTGETVEVFTDAYPDRAVKGYICFISDKAEFTPREVQSREERVKQVFETKVCFEREHPPEFLKKGMPVDVRIPVMSQKSG